MKTTLHGKGYLIGSLWVIMFCAIIGCKENYDFDNTTSMNTNNNTSTISPDEQEVSFDVKDFEEIYLNGNMSIKVLQGATYSLKIKGDPTDIQDLNISAKANLLHIYYKQSREKRYKMTALMTVPSLRKIKLEGAISSVFDNFQNTKAWSIQLIGASKIEIPINAETLETKISGASAAKLTGVCSDVSAKIEGASFMDGSNLNSKNTSLEVNGTSSASIKVSNKLNVVATGASSVYYYGDPATNIKTDGVCIVQKK
jgi:Putative auto-transporter adhesin, head GIN domain